MVRFIHHILYYGITPPCLVYQALQKNKKLREQVLWKGEKSISWTWRSFFLRRHSQQPHFCACAGPIFVRRPDYSYRCDLCNGMQRLDDDSFGPSISSAPREEGILITPGLAITEAARTAGNAILTHVAAAQTSVSALAGRMGIARKVSQRSLESYIEWCTRVSVGGLQDTSTPSSIVCKSSCPTNTTTKYDQEEKLEETMQNALYGLRFAVAAYALPYELGYFDGVGRGLRLWMPSHHRYVRASTADQVTAVRRILCGARDDPLLEVAYARYSACLWQPCFVVILDHHTQRVVIAFRGTLSAADLIADMAGGYTNVHLTTYRDIVTGKIEELYTQIPSGFYTNVMDAGTHLTHLLNIIRKQYPNYKLLFVGHSLGAVEAILFHLLFLFPTHHGRNDDINKDNIHTIAFGPAPCIEHRVVTKVNELIGTRALTSWVYGLDGVPRLQARSVHGLFYPPSSYTNINTTTPTNDNSNNETGVPLLAIPGRLLHVPEGATTVVEVPLDAPWRQQIVLGKQMLQDHLPVAYSKALYRVVAEWEDHKGERIEKK
ncbi:Fungal lipase-like domain [Trypanosoma melophagium]|uniref:Fungal lipase-like domain n=1 Tax=Trypanosoma melophagium TaxID=715481 RepID=UPI00351A6BA1|nr:Fungal lipase-like domain [Trypanosoma melophagium]